MIVREINKSLLDTDLGFIAHGVNCQNRMGSGVAKAIYKKYPTVKTEYHRFCENSQPIHPKHLLGTVQSVPTDKGMTVFNLFTQENFGYDGKLYLSYGALEQCFLELVTRNLNAIAIPKIGCGLAGGDWQKVSQIINETTKDKIDVYVYY